MEDNGNKLLRLLPKSALVTLFVLIGCNCTRFIDIRCRPLSDYNRIKMVDSRTVEKVVFDSIQYREYLLSFCDTSTISGVFSLEEGYHFDKGFVLIVQKNSIKYEVIIVNDKHSLPPPIIPGRCYWMKIRPYFLQEENAYVSEIKKEIYHKHYVIYPAYILRNESRICTANLEDIYEYEK